MKFLFFVFMVSASLSSFAQESLEAIQVLDHHGEQTLVDFVPSVTVLKEEDLRKKRQNSLGDTLQNEAGVSSTGFGPNSSRPVIRGLDGSRIKILQNSLQILDASTQSLDHNIPIDPLIIDQIEIVRGPMSLLYGSGAVGGVVNVVTNRIHSKYQDGHVVELQTQGESVNNGISNSVRMDYGKDKWMLHVDGSTRNLQDQKIPNHARTRDQRQNTPLDPGVGEARHRLPNSASQQDTVGAGATRFFNRGSLGLAFNHFQSDYGTVAQRDVTINMLQNRFELNGEYEPQSRVWKKIRLKSAQSQYRHAELEGSQTGTVFKNSGVETRLEAINEAGKLRGVSGLQHQYTDFSATGEEAFLPKSMTSAESVFTFQEYSLEKDILSAGARMEVTQINAPENFGFTGYNGSVGYRRKLSQVDSVSLNYSYTERAPNFQELLADGEHIATGTYERGNNGLKKEKSHGMELGYRYQEGLNLLNASIYLQKFHDYIALTPNGTTAGGDNLPVYSYQQVDAKLYGMDIDGKARLTEYQKGQILGTFKFDFVRGINDDNGQNLPRLSPPRISAGVEYLKDNFQTDLEVQHVTQQSHTAVNERITDPYTLTNIGGQYSFLTTSSKFDVFLRVRNLFNVEARSHVSFLKEIAPLPGRNIILGAHWLL
jgi:iron complex outermembrane recepter protein